MVKLLRGLLLAAWWIGFVWFYVALFGFFPLALTETGRWVGRWLAENLAVSISILSAWSIIVIVGMTHLDPSCWLKSSIIGYKTDGRHDDSLAK